MIAQRAAGDSREEVFRRWLKEHAGLVFKVARTFAPSDADRDDLVQEILLQLWRSLPRFEGKDSESTRIYRVALNTALAWHRSENKHRAAQTPLLAIEELPEPDDAARRERDELVTRLYAAIRRLPKVDAALVLLYLDDLSYREMAEVLGISETNVSVKLKKHRATDRPCRPKTCRGQVSRGTRLIKRVPASRRNIRSSTRSKSLPRVPVGEAAAAAISQVLQFVATGFE